RVSLQYQQGNMKKISGLILILLFVSCSSSFITSSWQPQDQEVKKYNRIMVIGIIRETDNNLRESMELHLAGDLEALGYNVFSAFKVYGPKGFEHLTEEEAVKKLKNDGVDAVMTIVLLDKHKEKYYTPGSVAMSPYMSYHNHF